MHWKWLVFLLTFSTVSKFLTYSPTCREFCTGMTACPPVNEQFLFIPVILRQWIAPVPPSPLTVLSITSTPIVCVVLTRQGINWVLLMPAFWSASFERSEPASGLRTLSSWRPLWLTLFTDIEDVSSLWVQCVIRLFSHSANSYTRRQGAWKTNMSAELHEACWEIANNPRQQLVGLSHMFEAFVEKAWRKEVH